MPIFIKINKSLHKEISLLKTFASLLYFYHCFSIIILKPINKLKIFFNFFFTLKLNVEKIHLKKIT